MYMYIVHVHVCYVNVTMSEKCIHVQCTVQYINNHIHVHVHETLQCTKEKKTRKKGEKETRRTVLDSLAGQPLCNFLMVWFTLGEKCLATGNLFETSAGM